VRGKNMELEGNALAAPHQSLRLSVAFATPFAGLANVAPDLMPIAVTAAVKALVGLRRNDPIAWSRLRAPLASLGKSDVRKLGGAVEAIRSRRAA
jgi:hypothetical protein